MQDACRHAYAHCMFGAEFIELRMLCVRLVGLGIMSATSSMFACDIILQGPFAVYCFALCTGFLFHSLQPVCDTGMCTVYHLAQLTAKNFLRFLLATPQQLCRNMNVSQARSVLPLSPRANHCFTIAVIAAAIVALFSFCLFSIVSIADLFLAISQ
eukprot:scpid56400/ scgid14942/ 